jgi:hypothetical protein
MAYAYCHFCGAWAVLGPAAMCGRCRDAWHPPGACQADLGYRDRRHP